jgi:hypothetical protein
VTIDNVNQCIEAMCQCGCDAVRATIEALKLGDEIPQVALLSSDEKRRVLEELKAIMAVYDQR